jgi:hypothetical protein
LLWDFPVFFLEPGRHSIFRVECADLFENKAYKMVEVYLFDLILMRENNVFLKIKTIPHTNYKFPVSLYDVLLAMKTISSNLKFYIFIRPINV